jgi:hypothetical protein
MIVSPTDSVSCIDRDGVILQGAQNVHSKLQIYASLPCVNPLPHFSQTSLISKAISISPLLSVSVYMLYIST